MQTWIDWKNSPFASIESQEIADADHSMYELAVQGNVEGVNDLVQSIETDLVPRVTIDDDPATWDFSNKPRPQLKTVRLAPSFKFSTNNIIERAHACGGVLQAAIPPP